MEGWRVRGMELEGIRGDCWVDRRGRKRMDGLMEETKLLRFENDF